MVCRFSYYIEVGHSVGKNAVFGKEAVLSKINDAKKFVKARKKRPIR